MMTTSQAGQPVNGRPLPRLVLAAVAAVGASSDAGELRFAASTRPPTTSVGLLDVVSSTAPVGAVDCTSPWLVGAGAGWTEDAAVSATGVVGVAVGVSSTALG